MRVVTMRGADELDFLWLSSCFTKFFEGTPWNEYMMCPYCKDPNDYGPSYAWSISEAPTVCPYCKGELSPYWSPDRVKGYLSSHEYIGKIVLTDEGEIVAWAWGYELDANRFYVDTVAIMEQYRRNMKEFLTYFMEYVGERVAEKGYKIIRTRTHKSARNVRFLLRRLGFAEREASDEDPDRSYWEINLKEVNHPLGT